MSVLPMKLTGQFPLKLRPKVFLASYRLRLVFANGASALVGRGSVGVIGHLCHFSGAVPTFPLISIGNFCESAEARILLDGDHVNDQIFNLTLGDFPMIREALRREGIESWRSRAKAQTVIGNAVVLSKECIVLSGAQIGDGALVGAGAVVSRSVPDFCIAAGNPCQIIRERLTPAQREMASELRWWDFDILCFLKYAGLLLDIEKNFVHLKRVAEYDEQVETVVLSYVKSPEIGAAMTIKVIGVDFAGEFRPIGQMPAIDAYFAQLYAPATASLVWVPDIFREPNGVSI